MKSKNDFEKTCPSCSTQLRRATAQCWICGHSISAPMQVNQSRTHRPMPAPVQKAFRVAHQGMERVEGKTPGVIFYLCGALAPTFIFGGPIILITIPFAILSALQQPRIIFFLTAPLVPIYIIRKIRGSLIVRSPFFQVPFGIMMGGMSLMGVLAVTVKGWLGG